MRSPLAAAICASDGSRVQGRAAPLQLRFLIGLLRPAGTRPCADQPASIVAGCAVRVCAVLNSRRRSPGMSECEEHCGDECTGRHITQPRWLGRGRLAEVAAGSDGLRSRIQGGWRGLQQLGHETATPAVLEQVSVHDRQHGDGRDGQKDTSHPSQLGAAENCQNHPQRMHAKQI